MRNKVVACAVAAGSFAACAGSSHAQIWIGQIVGDMAAGQAAAQREQACMSGAAMSEKEIAEARIPALATMQGYFADAKAGASFAQRFQPDGKSLWMTAGARAGVAELGRQRDPTAGGDSALDSAPVAFVRAGDGASAMGQWVARAGSGNPVATYTATFSRKAGVWRLSTLSQSAARAYVDPVTQYCHKAGDVLPYRLTHTTQMREFTEKQLAKAEARARKAEQPGHGEGPEFAQVRQRQIAKLREAVETARADEAKARADAKAAEEEKAKAIAALAVSP